MDNIAKTLGEVRKRTASSILRLGGGGGLLNKVLDWKELPRYLHPLPFYIPFLTEKAPLSYTFYLTNGTPFTYLV